MPDRKNVLFIVIDQLRADCLSGALAEHVALPNLRALSAESTTFRRHYSVTNPCGPSRVSILTGKYAMNHRSVRNGSPLAHDTPNIAREARKAGYEPLLFGYTDTAQDPRAFPEGHEALTTYEYPMDGFTEVVEMRLEESHPWRAHLKAKGYAFDAYEDLFHPAPVAGRRTRPDDPALYRAEDSDTAFLTDQFLQHMAGRDPGWFAHLTYIRPHPPLCAPTPYNRMVDPAALPLPMRLSQAEETAFHPYMKPLHEANPMASVVKGFPDLEPTDENIQMLRAIYLGLAAEVDHHLGRVLRWLDDSGQRDDTLLIVTADHGEMLGDRQAWGKMAPFDAAFHTPLMIRAPGGTAGEVAAFTESTDISPTILDWLGTDIPSSMDGRSLLPFVAGQSPDWRDYSYSELDFADPILKTPWQQRLGTHQSNSNLAILREDRFTLVEFAADVPPLLFDHHSAGELENVAEAPAMQGELLRLTRKLLKHRMGHMDHTLSTTMISPAGPLYSKRPR